MSAMADQVPVAVPERNQVRESAVKALRIWRHRFAELDHSNEEHISAYCLVREKRTRVSPEQVLAVLRTQSSNLTKGVKIARKFHLVPRVNWPKVPSGTKDLVYDRAYLAARYEVPDALDFGEYYVVDYSVPAMKLGSCVDTIEFFSRLGTTLTLRDDVGTAATGAGSSQQPPLALEDKSADAEEATAAEALEPQSKRARVLKALKSDTVDTDPDDAESQAKALAELVQRIKKAAKIGALWSADESKADTVAFWCHQALGSMRSAKGKKCAFIRENFPMFVTKTLLDNKSLHCLQPFVKIMDTLKEQGCAMPPLWSAIRQMTAYKLDSQQPLALDDSCDLKTRLRFFDSVLYKDFQRARAASLFTAAATAQDAAKRTQLLQALVNARDSLSDETALVKGIDQVRSMFCNSLPKRERLMYALKNAEATRLALTWSTLDGDADFKSLAPFMEATADWSSLDSAAFLALVTDIIATDNRAAIGNPVAIVAVDVVKNLRSEFGSRAWCESAITAAVSHRLRTNWECQFDGSEVESKDVKGFLKALKGVSHESTPEWVTALKARIPTKPTATAQVDGEAAAAAAAPAAQEAATASAAAPAAAEAPVAQEEATAAKALDTSKAKEEEGDTAAAEAQETAASSAGGAAASSAGGPGPSAAKAAAGARAWTVGDIVSLSSKLKRFNKCRAQVTNVLTKQLDVALLDGTEKGKTWRCTHKSATLIMASTLSFKKKDEAPKEPQVVKETEEERIAREQREDEEARKFTRDLLGSSEEE